MKKLVLAIIAVCCAQLAYTAYNATEAGRQEFARIVNAPIVAPFFAGTKVAELEPTPDMAVDLDQNVAVSDADTPRPRRTIRRKSRKNQFVTYDRTFETTSIVVPKGEKYEFKQPATDVESNVASFTATKPKRTVLSAIEPEKRREKRSILDKTGSVIKKPFKWLKDLFAKND